MQDHLPPLPKRARPPTHSQRAIFNAIFYVLRTGCPWRYLPINFPRLSNGVLPFPPFAFQGDLDAPAAKSPSGRTRAAGKEPATQRRNHRRDIRVKTVEESSSISGYDAHKHVKGRKRHILVDTLGIPLSIYVTEADVHDTNGTTRKSKH